MSRDSAPASKADLKRAMRPIVAKLFSFDAKFSTIDKNISEIDARFDQVDARFAEVDARFDQVDARFAEVDARFDKVDARFSEVDARFDKVDARFAEVDARFDKVDARFAEVDARFDKVDARFAEVDARFDQVDSRLDGLEKSTRKLTIEMVKTQAEIREMKAVMSTKADIDRVMSAISGFAAKAEDHNRAMVLHGQALTEASVALKNHDRRIAALESRPA